MTTARAQAAGVTFEADALDEAFRLSKGYPYFLQEWGYQSWHQAPTSTITLAVIAASNAKIFAPIIDMNSNAMPQPAIVLMMREIVAERKLSISGSVTTITEMIAHIRISHFDWVHHRLVFALLS